MRIIARKSLNAFVGSLEGHKDQSAIRSALAAWFAEVSQAQWQSSAEVKQTYATVSIVSADRLVFNIKGNSYRLVVAVNYRKKLIWIKWIGSHKAYDLIDAKKVRHLV